MSLSFNSLCLGDFFVSKATNSVTEPSLILKGTETHDVYDLSNVFYVKTSDGAIELPYEPDVSKNISFSVLSVEPEKQFENVTLVSPSGDTDKFDYTIDLLRDANGISYLLMKMTNKTALAPNTWYYIQFENTIEKEVDNDYYLLLMGEVEALQGTMEFYYLHFQLVFLDEYGNEREIWLDLESNDLDNIDLTWERSTGQLVHRQNATKSNAIQIQIRWILETLGKSWSIVKLEKVRYKVAFYTASTLDSQYEIAGKVYTAIVSPVAFKVNNVLLNYTKTISFKATRSISSTLEINKIADVSIPFVYTVEPEKSCDAESLSIKYDYLFSLPSDSALSFSSVIANVTKGDGNVSYFYINGADYKETLESQGYYSWSVSAGTQYYVTLKIEYTEEQYDAIIGIDSPPPLTWATAGDWLSYWFWYIVGIVAAILTPIIGSSIAKKAKAGKRRSKSAAKNKL